MPLREPLQRALGDAYTIERELAGGGMSRLYLAHDNALGRRVVVKVLPRERSEGLSVERFRAEVRTVAALQHPNVVQILTAGEVEALPYYVMPYIEGESVRVLLDREGPLPPRRVVAILRDVARACAFAHARGVVHRDIKPDNILLAGGAALITDFGVAKALSAAARQSSGGSGTLTREGFTVGTPAYMAPEQLAGDPSIDHRADFYALGVTAYEMLAGTTPFAHLTPRALLAAQLTEPPPPLRSVRPDVPPRFAALVAQCLEKDPARRPPDAEAFLAALDDPLLLSGEQRAASSGTLRTQPMAAVPVPGRRMGKLAVAGGLLAVLAGAAIVLFGGGGDGSAAGPRVGRLTLAVLPFTEESSDGGDEYLADGVADGLARLLASVPRLRVTPRSGTERYRADRPSPAEIGAALEVPVLLEGTLRRREGGVEVETRLVDAASGSVLDRRTARGPVADLPRLQEELAGAAVSALGKRYGRMPRTPLTARSGFRSAESYDHYLRGVHAFRRRGAAALQEAIAEFQQAVTLDSLAATAYAGLADAHALLPLYAGAPPVPTLERALLFAEKAVALDSTSAPALAARGNVYDLLWRWEQGAADLRRAIVRDSDFAPAHQWYGENRLLTGHPDDAVPALARAAELDPWSSIVAGVHGVALTLAGRTEDGVQSARRAVDLDPGLAAPRILLGAVYLYAHRPFDAVFTLAGALEIEPQNPQVVGLLGYAYGVMGQPERAQVLLRRLERMRGQTGAASAIARIHLALGHPDEAMRWLERAARERDPLFVSEPLLTPIFQPLEQHPRFRALLVQIGIPVRSGRSASGGR